LRQYLDKQKIVIYADNVKFHRANILKLFLEVHKKNGNKAFTRIFARPESRGKGVAAYAESITHNRYLSSLKECIAKFWRLLSACLLPNLLLHNLCVIKYLELYKYQQNIDVIIFYRLSSE
jgi:hypothetical protein